ncbi:MAG: zinc ABC transporter solute-binding protein [Psychromonas sp.]|nr:zinc ABC transporter solute-binding protein [Alteromonadales bacterium]MCP5078686.1 zinc ABC transporter solute-binding protein [Psychromonas sp.]
MSKQLFRTIFMLLIVMISVPLKAQKLVIGITLQPYYSYVKAVVGDKAEILPLVDAGFNPHNYQPQVQDLSRLQQMDLIVVNGIGHDDFAMKVIQAADRSDLHIIYANQDIPLLPAMGESVGQGTVNPHTFVGLSTTMQKVYSIANQLAVIDPSNASSYRKNARSYVKRLRQLKQQTMQTLADLSSAELKVATTHNAYAYLLQDFAVQVVAVIEPAHGVEPSASQLQQTINNIKNANINVLFYELNMPNKYVNEIEKATRVKLYRFSHMTHGPYQAEKVYLEMQHNLATLVEAIRYVSQQQEKQQ